METVYDMYNFFRQLKIPKYYLDRIADMTMTVMENRPVADIFVFDQYLHDVCGNYDDDSLPDSESKSMEDILNERFDSETVEKLKYYLLV